jgi:hypothetical protein
MSAGMDFKDELVSRHSETEPNFLQLDTASISPVQVQRTADGFSSELFDKEYLCKIFFESQLEIPNGNWLQKFFLKRDLDLVTSSHERTSNKVKAKVWTSQYRDLAHLERLESEDIPSFVGDVKVSCFALPTCKETAISKVVDEALKKVPEGWFENISELNRNLMPYFEAELLRAKCVLLDPCINLRSDWRSTNTISGVILT